MLVPIYIIAIDTLSGTNSGCEILLMMAVATVVVIEKEIKRKEKKM